MGSPEDEPDRDADEEPLHEVCLDGFWMGRTEVTNAQYRQFDPGHRSGAYQGLTLDGETQPAVHVSWHDARAFARWLSRANGVGDDYRLPTEAEWEYACRAGTSTARFWGDSPDLACRFANVHDKTSRDRFSFGWSCHECVDGYAVAAPVGRFPANRFDLSDMLGHVSDWCHDSYDTDAYRQADRNGPGTPEGGKARVFRGGSWDYSPGSVRCANRNEGDPDRRSSNLGFRLVREPSPSGTESR